MGKACVMKVFALRVYWHMARSYNDATTRSEYLIVKLVVLYTRVSVVSRRVR
jgi:hypothetical protein